jgi:hypothetical protein
MRFHYTEAMTRLVAWIAGEMAAFRHLDTQRMLIAFSQARADTTHGTFAKVVPLRFEGGALTTQRGGRSYTLQRVSLQGREMLYLVYFYLPRFQNLTYHRKLQTLFHELFHISPRFDGDIRRFPGPNYAHGRSREWYDALVEPFVEEFLALEGGAELAGFLQPDYLALKRERGPILGLRIPMPRLIRVVSCEEPTTLDPEGATGP